MATTAQALIWILFLILLIGTPIMEIVRLRRAQQAEGRADAAQATLDRTLAALDDVQQQALQRRLTGCHPLRTPPRFAATREVVAEKHPGDVYALPLGWLEVDGVPDLATVSLHGDSPYKINHVLVTGETDTGKDGWLFGATATLCTRATPQALQLFWIDGKGPDGALWRGKQHNWRPPVTTEAAIPEAITALEAERTRRMQMLERHGVTKWEELPAAVRPPLLWIVVSELKLLKKALGGELEAWLERELAAARAAGLRYVLATQTASNMKMEWRSQIGLFVGGFQSSRDGDKPNVGLSTEELREYGALPPSEIPGAGYFTVRLKRQVLTVKAPLITLPERKTVLAFLPDAPVSSTITEETSTAFQSSGSGFPHVEETGENAAIRAVAEVGSAEKESDADRAARLLAEKPAEVEAAIMGGKTDPQVVAQVFGVTGGRWYSPLETQVAAVRVTLDRELTPA